jgi:hypothetical protein
MIGHKLPNKTKSATVAELKLFHQLNNPLTNTKKITKAYFDNSYFFLKATRFVKPVNLFTHTQQPFLVMWSNPPLPPQKKIQACSPGS